MAARRGQARKEKEQYPKLTTCRLVPQDAVSEGRSQITAVSGEARMGQAGVSSLTLGQYEGTMESTHWKSFRTEQRRVGSPARR